MKKSYRLSAVLAGGLFLLLALISAAFITVTYFSAYIIVENEDEELLEKSGVISNLVAETRLDVLKHSIDLISEDQNFNTLDPFTMKEQRLSYLRSAFYTQREGTIDMMAMLSPDGEYLAELNTEIDLFTSIKNEIRLALNEPDTWFWAAQSRNGSHPAVLIYYKREIVNGFSGRVEGYLVGGVFLNNNRKLLGEIRRKTGADFVMLRWNGKVLSKSDGVPTDMMLDDQKFDLQEASVGNADIRLYTSTLLGQRFINAGFSLTAGYPSFIEKQLHRLLLISSGLAILLAVFLTGVFAFVSSYMFIGPLKNLIMYARMMEKHDRIQKLPVSLISEFNELGHGMENVFAAFLESETRFKDIVSVTADSVWETDENDRYVFLARDENTQNVIDMNKVLGKKRWEIEGVDQGYGDWEEHWKILANREPFQNFVMRLTNNDGHFNYWSISGKPRFGNMGEFCGYRGSSTNITNEIDIQEEAKRMEEMLRQSQKLEIVSQLTGGVAHDFNNLLAVVVGNLELLKESGLLGAKELKYLADALRSADKGADLTRQLLAYSRQQTLNSSTILVNDVVEGLTDQLEKMLGGRVSFKTDLKETWPILVDTSELQTALYNLALNARDAMSQGGEFVIESFDIHLDDDDVVAMAGLAEGDYVCLVVTDTGVGISEDILDRIMDPFFTTKDVGKGSGLGLSMVYGFIKQSGGHIGIYSEVGNGTSLQLFFPRAIVNIEQQQLQDPQALKRGNGEVVLVVEDNVEVRNLVISQLKRLNYRTLECPDGPTAFSILENEPIDMLISDVTLPLGVNGVDIANYAKEQYPHMPVLLMSGFTWDAIRQREKLDAGVEVLSKPFTKMRLSAALVRAKNQKLKSQTPVSGRKS